MKFAGLSAVTGERQDYGFCVVTEYRLCVTIYKNAVSYNPQDQRLNLLQW
jgi:hypothetical protein